MESQDDAVFSCSEDTIDVLIEDVNKLLANPLDLSESVDPEAPDSPPITSELSKSLLEPLGVKSLQVGDLYRLDYAMPSWVRTNARKYLDGKGGVFPPSIFYQPVHLFQQNQLSVGALLIDLGLPDAGLERDFRLWLKAIRLSQAELAKRPKRKSSRDQDELLMCTDLILWATVNRRNMTDAWLAKVMNPKRASFSDSVAKTIRPMATAILEEKDEGLRFMKDQANKGWRDRAKQDLKKAGFSGGKTRKDLD